jgi:HEAT repeat protein
MSDLRRLPASGETMQARHQALARLRALFELEPSAVGDALRTLKSGEAGETAPALLGALSDSQSPQARDALVELGKDSALSPDLRADAITNLSLDRVPDAKTFDDLQELSGNGEPAVSDSATLGLGTAARQGADSDETRPLAEKATQELSRRFGAATSSGSKVLYLDSLGNAGGEAALAASESALSDPDAAVRAAAVSSLRFAPAPRADELIARVWLNDPEGEVRQQATLAASFRQQLAPLAEAAVRVLKSDPEVAVRVGVAQLMGDHVTEFPAFAAALTDAVKTDANEDVKVAAARALGNAAPSAEPEPHQQ